MKYNLSEKNIEFLFKYWLTNAEDVCDHCLNNVDCKTCCDFEEIDSTLPGNEWIAKHYINYKFNCMDINFGTCKRLENTPCNGCFENGMSGFELKGGELW